jgi:hypothetical protein
MLALDLGRSSCYGAIYTLYGMRYDTVMTLRVPGWLLERLREEAEATLDTPSAVARRLVVRGLVPRKGECPARGHSETTEGSR